MGMPFIQQAEEVLLKYTPSWRFEEVLAKLGFDSEGKRESPNPDDSKPETCEDDHPETSKITIRWVFHFTPDDLVEIDVDRELLVFRFATVNPRFGDEYYAVPGKIFDIDQTVLLDSTIKLEHRLFGVGYDRRTSVMSAISKMLDKDTEIIAIGGSRDDAIPTMDYEALLNEFPTTQLLQHYGEAQIESYIADYLHTAKDYATEYEHAKDRRRKSTIEKLTLRSDILDESRLETVATSYAMMKEALDSGALWPEEKWQKQVLEILTTLYPQYVSVIPKAEIRDVTGGKKRYPDFLLVDSSGNVDVLEIKRAFPKSRLIMQSPYRESYIPARELSGGIAQIEKYIYLLLNWGPEGERVLTKRYHDHLPEGMKLRFLNPRGLLLIGNCAFAEEEQRDFDIICRQYSHIADIVTYNDMLTRLKRMLWSITAAKQ
ncbi:MAG: DUF4263 domain-containing protein [Eggerthellaceae bacterium]|nr:DUF4263 domain-containing protein [Eggerthellaceae bacterium]